MLHELRERQGVRVGDARDGSRSGVSRFAYYHGQDEDYRRAGKDVYIGYGVAPDEDLEPVLPLEKVGWLVCLCLAEAGLSWTWTGYGKDKILVQQKPGVAEGQTPVESISKKVRADSPKPPLVM